MSKDNDGGPAFPTRETKTNGGFMPGDVLEVKTDIYHGMSLRDWFAGQALTSGRVLFGSNIRNAEDLAKDMYKIADAMIKEREK